MQKLLFFLIFFIANNLFAAPIDPSKRMTIDLQNIAVQDALHIIAKSLKQNIIVSSWVHGSITLHLHDMTAEQMFDFILNSEGLTKLQENSVWMILPRNLLIQEKQTEWKQQEILMATAPLITQVWQIRYAKAENIAHLIQDGGHSLLSKRGFLQMDVRTNQICVRDIQESIAIIGKLIKRIDIPVKQVLIEARLASVDSDFERQLGIHFSIQKGEAPERTALAASPPASYSLAVAKLVDGSLLDVQLAALENAGKGELISSPSLFTANQQPASIESGEEIPYQEISRSGATGVAFKKAVLSLKVTPQILPNDRVQLQLQMNQDRPSSREVLGVPAITTRQISSNVLLRNGQTIVLGGIFESSQGDSTERIPFLGNIPVIGLLFAQHNKAENKRELLIFITPRIIDG
ncbi:MAG TPA: secretin N-terminal domain-containing protein [Gammaproteobacteria bacterium]|nr:secretin N-terminal domain-containing protein [Gammaproteobacteria bacterium]